MLFAPRVLPPLRPNVQEDPGPYSDWVKQREGARPGLAPSRTPNRTLRLVMVVEREPPPETVLTLRSLHEQTDTNWKLWAALPEAQHPNFASLLGAAGMHAASSNVEVLAVPGPVVASQMLDTALRGVTESDIALIFPGDVWAPDAVSTMASQLTPTAVVYADEDRMDAVGSHSSPRLKPGYSPEFLYTRRTRGDQWRWGRAWPDEWPRWVRLIPSRWSTILPSGRARALSARCTSPRCSAT